MDNNKFNEESKEQLEKEIQELKRQKEIRDLQRQKEELEKTISSSVGGSTAEKKEKKEKERFEKIEENSKKGTNFFSNRKTAILSAAAALFIVVIGSGIFYLNAQKERKKDSFGKNSVSEIFNGQNMASVTTPQVKTDEMSGKEASETIFKEAMNYLQGGDYSSMNSNAKDVKTLELFTGAIKKVTYKINNTTEIQNKVTLNVTMKYPDLSDIQELLNEKVSNNAEQLKGKSDEIVEQTIEKWMKELIDHKVSSPDLKYLEETFDMVYTKVNGEWTLSDEGSLRLQKIMKFNLEK